MGAIPTATEITLEIQRGYYGRPLDPARPDDPKDRQGFAYPVYVVFLLAPTGSPFETVQLGFLWLLIALAATRAALAAGSGLETRRVGTVADFLVLMLGWLPMVQGIKLQQLSLLVAASAGGVWRMPGGRMALFGGGRAGVGDD